MKELYVTAKKWFDKTFGRSRDPYAMITKMMEETDELARAIDNYERWTNQENRNQVQYEIADVMIVLMNMASNYGMCYNTLEDGIRIKLAVNMKRNWEEQPDGTFKHVKENE